VFGRHAELGRADAFLDAGGERSPVLLVDGGPGCQVATPSTLTRHVSARISGVPEAARDPLVAAAALSRPTAELVERAASADGLFAARARTEIGRLGLRRSADGELTESERRGGSPPGG
jgi:hypothetical protein